MLGLMYDLPEAEPNGTTFLIDANAITNQTPIHELAKPRAKESA